MALLPLFSINQPENWALQCSIQLPKSVSSCTKPCASCRVEPRTTETTVSWKTKARLLQLCRMNTADKHASVSIPNLTPMSRFSSEYESMLPVSSFDHLFSFTTAIRMILNLVANSHWALTVLQPCSKCFIGIPSFSLQSYEMGTLT